MNSGARPDETQPLLHTTLHEGPLRTSGQRHFIDKVQEFLNVEPPATTVIQEYGLVFEQGIVFLIALNTITFILSTESTLYGSTDGQGCSEDLLGFGNSCWTRWRWLFEIVEWITAITFTVELIFRVYAAGRVLRPVLDDHERVNRDGDDDQGIVSWRNRAQFLFSFYGLVDLFSVVPFYVDLITPEDLPAVQWIRLLRLFKIMQTKARFAEAFGTFHEIFREKGGLLLTSSFVGGSVWLVVSSMYYLAEKENPAMILQCGPDYTLNRMGSIPSASFFALVNLFGEFPVIDSHNAGGMAIGTFVALFAVALFGIPTGIIASGFESKVVERQTARREASKKAARCKWQWAAQQISRQTKMQAVLAFESNIDRPKIRYGASKIDENHGDDSIQGHVYRFASTRTGQIFERFITFLILLNIGCFFATTMPSVVDHGLATEGSGPLWIVEAVSVAVFSVEYLLRIWTVGQEPNYAGWRGRCKYLISFYSIVDLAAILPFYVDLALPEDFSGTTFIRALRLIRLLKGRRELLKFEEVLLANSDVLEVTGFFAVILWIFFSTFMYYAERNNPCNADNCNSGSYDCDDVASSYQSIPSSMWITLLNLSGEVPIADYTPVGKVLVAIMGVSAVGLFGIPIGVLAAGFEEWSIETETPSSTSNSTSCSGDALEDGFSISHRTHSSNMSASVKSVRHDVFIVLHGGVQGDTTWPSRLGSIFLHCIFGLIFITAAIALLQTDETIMETRGLSDAFGWIEAISVVIFTAEYVARFYSSPEDPALKQQQVRFEKTFSGIIGARILFLFSFYSLVDLLAIVPWYLATAGVQWADDSDEFLRLFRLFRLVSLDRFVPSISLIDDVFRANKAMLLTTAYIAGVFWFVFATLLYLSEERNNTSEAGRQMSQRFSSIPESLQYSAIFLTGDFPLTKFTIWGRIINFFNVVVAVGVVGLPASVLAGGFADLLDQRRQDDLNSDSDRDGDGLIDNRTVSCCFGEGFNVASNHPVQKAVYNHLEGKTSLGRVFQRFMISMILLNVIAVVIESVDGVYSAAPGFWSAFEIFSVVFFTLDYALRLYSAPQNPRCGYSRAVYATTFLGVVDLASFAPFYIEALVLASTGGTFGSDGSDAEVFRVVRILRLFALEHFLEAFTLLDDVYRECRPILMGTGVLALLIWVGGAVLFYLFEAEITSVPQSLFYTAVFLGGEWTVCDFSIPGKVLCVLFCIFGIALYGTCVGFLCDAFAEVLERRAARQRVFQ